MQVDDKAARGREAALRVRRRKKKDRQAAVRELEERSAPRMQILSELEALGFKVSQSTVRNDLAELGYGQRRPRRHPKPEPRPCEVCGEEFTPKDASQDVRGFGRLCSEECKRRKGGLVAATRRHRLADEELERANADGYLTLRQAAEELRIGEPTIHRYVELGHIEVAERRRCHGEQWTLVSRDELKNFKAEDWPGLRRRHAEMRWEDEKRGWPRMPSTWKGETRRLWSRRARAPHVGKLKRRYTDEQAEQVRMVKTTYPTWGAVRIAEVVSKTSGKPITRDQVRRILEKPPR